MTRPRVEGVGRRVRRQVFGGNTNAVGSARGTRVLMDNSGYKLFSEGLSDLGRGVANVARVNRQEEQAEERRLRALSLVNAQSQKKRFMSDSASYLNDDPELAKMPLEQRLESNQEYNELFEAYFHQDAIPHGEVRARAIQELSDDFYVQALEAVEQEVKGQAMSATQVFIAAGMEQIKTAPGEERAKLATNIIDFGKKQNLSVDEVASLAIDAFSTLGKNDLVDPSILYALAKDPNISSKTRTEIGEAIATAKGNQSTIKNLKQQIVQVAIRDELYKLSDSELDDYYKSNSLEVAQLYTPKSFMADIKARRAEVEKHLKDAVELGQAAEMYFKGEVHKFRGDIGLGTDPKVLRKVEGFILDRLAQKYSEVPEADRQDYIDMEMLSYSGENNQVPLYLQDRVRFGALPTGISLDGEIPHATKDAVRTAKVLASRGLLATIDGKEEQALRAMIGLEVTGSTLDQAIRVVGMAIQDDKLATYAHPKQLNTARREIIDHFNGLGDGLDTEDFRLKQVNSTYQSVYSTQMAMSGGNETAAHEAAMGLIKESFVALEGNIIPKRAFRISEEQLSRVYTNILDEAHAKLPEAYERDDLILLPLNNSAYALSTRMHELLKIPDLKNRQNDGPYVLTSSQIEEMSSNLEVRLTRAAQAESKDDALDDIETQAMLTEETPDMF